MCTKKNTLIAVCTAASSIFFACSESKQVTTTVPNVQKNLPKFDYAPKILSKVGSSNITIALLNPTYGDHSLTFDPFENMRKSMANDFEELLTAKGFKVRGPFNQIGEMLYNDKLNSDFIFLVDIDLNFKNINRSVKKNTRTNWGKLFDTNSNSMEEVYYTYKGEGSLTCNLTLTATSSKFGEKLWKKNITLAPTPFKYTGTKQWNNSSVSLYNEILKDNSVYNEIADVLEKQYIALFELVEKQIEVDEMKTVSTEAHKVDGKN
jgi:hypothetical protein